METKKLQRSTSVDFWRTKLTKMLLERCQLQLPSTSCLALWELLQTTVPMWRAAASTQFMTKVRPMYTTNRLQAAENMLISTLANLTTLRVPLSVTQAIRTRNVTVGNYLHSYRLIMAHMTIIALAMLDMTMLNTLTTHTIGTTSIKNTRSHELTNAETFMVSKFSDPDTAKSLGFLLQCEHQRLIFTNECVVGNDKLLNGTP